MKRIFVLAGITVLLYAQQKDWPAYNGDPGGQRYSALTQINTKNVSKLKLAWQYGVDPAGIDTSSGEARAATATEAVPVMAGGSLHADPQPHHRRARARNRKRGLEIQFGPHGRTSARSDVLERRSGSPGADSCRNYRWPADRDERENRKAGAGFR